MELGAVLVMIKVFMGRNLCHGEGLSRHCEERQALGLAATKQSPAYEMQPSNDRNGSSLPVS